MAVVRKAVNSKAVLVKVFNPETEAVEELTIPTAKKFMNENAVAKWAKKWCKERNLTLLRVLNVDVNTCIYEMSLEDFMASATLVTD